MAEGHSNDAHILMQELEPPRAPYTSGRDSTVSADTSDGTTRSPSATGFDTASAQRIPLITAPQSLQDDTPAPAPAPRDYGEPDAAGARLPWYRRRRLVVGLVAAAVVILVVVLCVSLVAVKKKNKGDGGESPQEPQPSTDPGSNPTTTTPPDPNAPGPVFIGTDGATVTMEDGQTFVYRNSFGGYFVDASQTADPYNDGAKAQSYTPALNETWDYATNIIRGVNLGGWLTLEPFITPAYYDKYFDYLSAHTSSEWDLSKAMRADDSPGGGIQQIEQHYKTFITEQDFAEIAAAGLNWIRLPISYWAIEVWDGEPFLERVSWTYALKAFEWARKYGLRVNLDLHAVPGSQNGWNHSGKAGPINWMEGPMGVANAQRSLDYMRIIVQFISQPQYLNVVPMFGIINEPQVGSEAIRQFTVEAYTVLRNVTGPGKGPILSIFDDFHIRDWESFLPGADRVALDTHRYFAFDGQNKPNIEPLLARPCNDWGSLHNDIRRSFGIVTGGEFSLGYNDCGYFLVQGVANLHHTENCGFWENWEEYDAQTKKNLLNFARASMDGMRDFFFWTWKIGPNGDGAIRAPLWSYKLGLEQGWIPRDPRSAVGHCASHDAPFAPFDGPYPSSATATATAARHVETGAYLPWPPTYLDDAGGVLPTYTPTGAIVTLPGPTPGPKATVTVGGWAFPQDTQGMAVPVKGCRYPNAWTDHGAMNPIEC